KRKSPDLTGLDMNELKNMPFAATVNIIGGKHAGKTGTVRHAREEGPRGSSNVRLEVVCGKEIVYVDIEDIEGGKEYETFDLKLFIPVEEHEDWDRRVKELEEWNKGNPDY